MVELQSHSSSSSLIEAVRSRDPGAWSRLTAIYGPSVYQWCRRAGLQAADAADVMQLVFATVAENIEQFHVNRPGASFRGWLWTIFHSRLMDFYRAHRRQPELVGNSEVQRLRDEAFAGPLSQSSPENHDAEDLVRRALSIVRADFRETTWQAFWRTAVEDQAAGDVATDLGTTTAAVCMSRSRVLRRLRETLTGLGVVPDELL